MPKKLIYQIHCKLIGYKPSMWRRFKIDANTTLAELAYVLMSMYKMYDWHLFAFEIPKKNIIKNTFDRRNSIRFEIPNEDNKIFGLPSEDAIVCRLADVITEEKQKFYFEYDFEDGWELCLKLEKILNEDDGNLPIVLDGKGYGIIENCGGIWGLMDIDKIVESKNEKEYKELIELCDEEFLNEYLEGFNLKEINENLSDSVQELREFYTQV